MFGGHPLRGAAASPITVAATGDCILSRRVSHLKDQGFLDVVQLLRSADCAYGNCELVMAAGDPGYPTAAGSSLRVVVDPKMAEELAWLGYDLMGTANNHSTDYGVEGVRSTIANLERVGIGCAGTGMNLQQAAAPGYTDTPGGRVALINCASSFAAWSPAVYARGDFKGVPGLTRFACSAAINSSRRRLPAWRLRRGLSARLPHPRDNARSHGSAIRSSPAPRQIS
jgi:poly-gamma-glutamate synthesis protein (capsule biosynthesis protein)